MINKLRNFFSWGKPFSHRKVANKQANWVMSYANLIEREYTEVVYVLR